MENKKKESDRPLSSEECQLDFEVLFEKLHLGKIIEGPIKIEGGLLHKMYAVKTTEEKYAVKVLNPKIMMRPTALGNFINSERIANKVSENVTALPAKQINNTSIHEVNGAYYLIFDWVEGASIRNSEINIEQCKMMGSILAEIHKTDFDTLNIGNNRTDNDDLTNWKDYLVKGKENNLVWVEVMNENLENLYLWQKQANDSMRKLSTHMSISHRDLDSKNVLWQGMTPLIIDWESAGYINPIQDLLETALYWSENGFGKIDQEKFLIFIRAYFACHSISNPQWRPALMTGFSSKLGWLDYNLKRSLWIECNDEMEQQLGVNQVVETLELIKRYSELVDELEQWLVNEFK